MRKLESCWITESKRIYHKRCSYLLYTDQLEGVINETLDLLDIFYKDKDLQITDLDFLYLIEKKILINMQEILRKAVFRRYFKKSINR
jgi:hypothetical protein